MIIGAIAIVSFILLAIYSNVKGNIFVFTGTIAIGFLLGGILLVVDYFRTSRNQLRRKQIEKQLEINNEERDIFLRTKSGNESFGFSLWLMLGLWMLSTWVNMSLSMLFPLVLGFMFLSYLVSMVINTGKY
jgi:predicted lysophospholipase L1 biosynthesis ABC-type transport system permease subunit